MSGQQPARVEEVDAETLRNLFNKLELWDRLLDGELFDLTLDERPAPQTAGQPPGTLSRLDAIYEQGVKVAEVHYYLLPDGSVGASGMPDPKAVLVDDVLYLLEGRRRGP